jgi:hypothetical protein
MAFAATHSIDKIEINYQSKALQIFMSINIVDKETNTVIHTIHKDVTILKDQNAKANKLGLSHITTPLWSN